jgi:hypothetical protein
MHDYTRRIITALGDPRRLTRKCTECCEVIIEGELQAIPNEMPKSLRQRNMMLLLACPDIVIENPFVYYC